MPILSSTRSQVNRAVDVGNRVSSRALIGSTAYTHKKRFIWFENLAHMIEVEEPGRVLIHRVEDVPPLLIAHGA